MLIIKQILFNHQYILHIYELSKSNKFKQHLIFTFCFFTWYIKKSILLKTSSIKIVKYFRLQNIKRKYDHINTSRFKSKDECLISSIEENKAWALLR